MSAWNYSLPFKLRYLKYFLRSFIYTVLVRFGKDTRMDGALYCYSEYTTSMIYGTDIQKGKDVKARQ
jgi:hypothetical protein